MHPSFEPIKCVEYLKNTFPLAEEKCVGLSPGRLPLLLPPPPPPPPPAACPPTLVATIPLLPVQKWLHPTDEQQQAARNIMKRFWKRKDQVQPFHAPPNAPQSPGAVAAVPSRTGLFVGDVPHNAAVGAASGGGWFGREIDGRCLRAQSQPQCFCKTHVVTARTYRVRLEPSYGVITSALSMF